MDVNDYYEKEEENIINDDKLTEKEKQRYLKELRWECQEAAEDEAARNAEIDGYRRYM